MSTKTDKLRGTLAVLERKRADAVKRRTEIAAERERLAYAAVTAGKGAAQLGEAREKALRLDMEIQDIDAAIKSAKALIADSEREDGAEAVRANARRALPKVAELREDGRLAREAIAQLGAALGRMKSSIGEIGRLGIRAPSAELFGSNLRRALDVALAPHGLHHDLVPKSQRRELDELVDDYASGIAADIAIKLGGSAEAA